MHLTFSLPFLALSASAQSLHRTQKFYQPNQPVQNAPEAYCIAYTEPHTEGNAQPALNDGNCVVFDVKPNIVRSVLVNIGAHLELFSDKECQIPFGRYSIDHADIGVVNSMRCSPVSVDSEL